MGWSEIMAIPEQRRASFADVGAFVVGLYGVDLHAKRVESLAGATLGVMQSASLAVATIGQALAQARGLVTKHAIKQVDRMLSNNDIDVWDSFARWGRHQIGPDLVFGHLWQETGCQAVLRRQLAGRRFGFDVERAVYPTVIHRLMVSGSDRHASTWQQSLDIPGANDLMLDHAYKAMAWLGEAIEGEDRPGASLHRCHRRSAV